MWWSPRCARLFSTGSPYAFIKASSQGKVGIVQLNRPDRLNALSSGLFTELIHAVESYDQSKDIHAIILSGDEKAFAGIRE